MVNERRRNAEPQRIDRRRVRTRAALLGAGRSLFANRSPEAVSIDDIVAAADVAKGSFYNHFADKEAFARELAEQARLAVEALVSRVTDGAEDPAERVARALCGFAREAVDDPVGMRVQLRMFQGALIPDAPMNAGVRADVARGLEAGRFTGLGLEAGVLLAVGVFAVTVGRVMAQADARTAPALAREMAAALLRGLGLNPSDAESVALKTTTDIFVSTPVAD